MCGTLGYMMQRDSVCLYDVYPALQVQVSRVTVLQSYTEAELRCHSSCSPAGRLYYIWFKNGQKNMTEQTSTYTDYFYPGDNIYCAFRGHEDYRSPSVCEFTPNLDQSNREVCL